jgi:uncharacterized protein YdiU (UPF0061 family)
MAKFQNSFTSLPSYFFEHVRPTPIKNAELIHTTSLKDTLVPELDDESLKRWLNGELALHGEHRIATRYAGHQFGVWAGQLGDGRAISLGEIETAQGKLEVQTKGSGLTPFSRMGDGKAVIRSSVREYLCSEAMHGLGIPTTRVLALITGEDPVYRESVERSAVVARVFPTNLRFGHFEMAYHFEKNDELKALIQYTRDEFFGGLSTEEMLREILKRTAKLMAQWQDVGFCHGVMNTDNMSILGLTIDYGPYGFLEDTDLGYICNHSDHQGRYAYNQQPSIGMWNLERLFVCFLSEVNKETLQEILNEYPSQFEKEYLTLARAKMGLVKSDAKDFNLFIEIMKTLSILAIDYTFFWRQLSQYIRGEDQSFKEIGDYYGQRKEIKEWLQKYDERLKLETDSDETRHERMKLHNPKYVLKNYIAQEVIDDVESGNSKKLDEWLKVLSNPFQEHPEFEAYSRPTPPEHKNYVVSCSS